VIIEGRQIPSDLELSADAVVVGSGASGAVVARELSRAGLDVVVLEEGGYHSPQEYARFRPTETLRHMLRLGGAQVAVGVGDTPTISVMSGRTVGGSSTVTGGVCFRIPPHVLSRWSELGLRGYSEADLEPCYQAVEREVGVCEVPTSMRSRSTALFAQGATAKGFAIKPTRRNTSGCVGLSRCNFGCPSEAKLSVDRTYLKDALSGGARLYSDCLVEKVVERNGRAAGIEGRVLNGPGGAPRGALRVRAKTVVVCAGTLHTPKILRRSRVGRRSGQLGRHLTLHPGFRVGAFFDRPVEGWKGAMQSAYSDALEAQGLTIIGIWLPHNVAAGAMPGIGRELVDNVRQFPNLALFGGMVHDEGGGRLFNVPGREPLIVYRMTPRDKERLLLGIKVLAECFFEAGARRVVLPLFGFEPLDSPDQLARLLDRRIPGRVIECASFHPLGSARMGPDPRSACVAPSGESFDLPGLYVGDGSLFPTSIGVNSQLPIMAVATKVAWGLRERLRA
jgi:choline dehydrogenase-like flavoprotein